MVQKSTESADPAAPEAERDNHVRLLVSLLTAKLMTKCHVLQNCSQEERLAHTKRLVNQTTEGLTVTKASA